jgi:hypothetical protein
MTTANAKITTQLPNATDSGTGQLPDSKSEPLLLTYHPSEELRECRTGRGTTGSRMAQAVKGCYGNNL